MSHMNAVTDKYRNYDFAKGCFGLNNGMLIEIFLYLHDDFASNQNCFSLLKN